MTDFLATPVGRAVRSMLGVALFAVLVHFAWGAFDPDMRSWSLLGVAPVVGILTYLQAAERDAAIATFFIILGSVGLAFWIALYASGLYPVARTDGPWVLLILAIPVACLGIGLQKRRQLRRGPGAPPV